ncbi:MAG: DUF3467 domain-containing protein [Deltaproteobacteria bacterium]
MATPPTPPAAIQLQIQLDDEIGQGMYVNMAVVNHSETEFTLDMIYVQPQQPKAKVRARLITSPKHMKQLLLAMQDQVRRFEQRFGPIEIPTFPPGTLPQ